MDCAENGRGGPPGPPLKHINLNYQFAPFEGSNRTPLLKERPQNLVSLDS